MNSLRLSDKDEKSLEKAMTTRELAETLGVDVKTIQRTVDSLDIDVERVGSSHTMVFNEAQATAIKIKLQNHSKVAGNCFDTLAISNDLEISMSNQKWYTIEDLASLCGLEIGSVKNILTELRKFGSNFEMTTKTVNVGGHKNVKEYSEEILRAIKEYQVKNAVPNATKNKGTASEGNISFVQNKAARQTIDTLMDNPDTLQLMLTASIERQQKLLVENKRLKSEKERLQVTLDQSKEWYSIKRMEKLNPGKCFNYRLLKNESRRLGLGVKKVFDRNYGEVNAYHRDVWESLYFDSVDFD